MIYALLILATALLSGVASAGPIPTEEKQFTVNLLTQVGDMAITSPKPRESDAYPIPIHYNNATIKHAYDNVTYAVIGSLTFNATKTFQSYHIDTDFWHCDVNITLDENPGQIQHLDLAVSKDEPSGMGKRFDFLNTGCEQVHVTNDWQNYTCTDAGWKTDERLCNARGW